MLRLTCIFLATVGIGGALGLFGLDGTAVEGARILFFMCLALSVLSIFMGRHAALQFRSERRPPGRFVLRARHPIAWASSQTSPRRSF